MPPLRRDGETVIHDSPRLAEELLEKVNVMLLQRIQEDAEVLPLLSYHFGC